LPARVATLMVSPKNGLIKSNSVGLQGPRKRKKKQASNESAPASMFTFHLALVFVLFATTAAAFTYVAASVTHLVALEVGICIDVVFRIRFFAAGGVCALVPVIGLIIGIYMALEVGRTTEPLTCPDEDSAGEPLRAIVTIGSAVIGGGFVVAVGTIRGSSDADDDLSLGCRGCGGESETSNNS
jgi:hypothetical protein